MRNPFALYPRRLGSAPRVRIARSQHVRSERALRGVPWIDAARVDLSSGRATIEHPGGPPAEAELAAALDGAVVARGRRVRLEAWAPRLRGAA